MPRPRLSNEELQTIYDEMADIVSGPEPTPSEVGRVAAAVKSLAFWIDQLKQHKADLLDD